MSINIRIETLQGVQISCYLFILATCLLMCNVKCMQKSERGALYLLYMYNLMIHVLSLFSNSGHLSLFSYMIHSVSFTRSFSFNCVERCSLIMQSDNTTVQSFQDFTVLQSQNWIQIQVNCVIWRSLEFFQNYWIFQFPAKMHYVTSS